MDALHPDRELILALRRRVARWIREARKWRRTARGWERIYQRDVVRKGRG